MEHLLIGRPVLDEMGFVARQHLDSVRDKFHLHDFSHIGEELLDMNKQPSGALSNLLLKPADTPEFTEDLPNVQPLDKGKKIKQREQIMPSVLNKIQYEVQLGENDDDDRDVPQPSIKFASLKDQTLFYSEIPDDDPIDYNGVDIGQGSSGELVDAIGGLVTGAEQAGMSQDGVQCLRQWVSESKDVFRLKLGADPPANVEAPCYQAARMSRTRANISSQERPAAAEFYA
jgi:hypothetical protein